MNGFTVFVGSLLFLAWTAGAIVVGYCVGKLDGYRGMDR